MTSKKLKKAIIETQGELLYTTFSEECAEVIQALSKIKRKKFFNADFSDEVDNLLEEITDVLINIDLMKEQLCKEKTLNMSMEQIESRIEYWREYKEEKCNKIFLKGE